MRVMRWALILPLALAASLKAQVHTYECDALPLESGWILLQNFCEAEEYVDDGRLVQPMEMCPGIEPPEGQQLDYRHYIDLESDTPRFFAEWKVEATGPPEEIGFVAPAAFVIASSTIPEHHFSISRSRVRYLRDNLDVPAEFFDIEAAIPHTFRVEHIGDQSYTLYIDNNVVSSGAPFGNLLWPDPIIQFRGKAKLVASTTTWYYMRWGVIPEDGSADFNSDGSVDNFDLFYIDECIERSASGESASPSCEWADMNGDDTVNCADWQIIRDGLWSGPGQPPPLAACGAGVPAASQWGLVVMGLLMLVLGSSIYRAFSGDSNGGRTCA